LHFEPKDTDSMSDLGTELNLFKPKPSRMETRADVTNHAARAIIGAEAEQREAKTARLRQARLEAEAKLAAAAPNAKPRSTKTRVRGSARS
jgi:hypothetical protein